jgi:NAD(P)-dependent dehydrogenase (short-subunit alcohol dehydrogenase family)
MTDISFEGRVAIVTGAGGGLGRAYALDIARRGGAVLVNDLGGAVVGGGASSEMADQTVAEIKAAGGLAFANYDDVSSPRGGRNMVAAALEAFGRIDAVIANAGTMRFGDFEDLSADDLNALLAVHVGGSYHVTQAAWPHMKAQGYGRVVFTTSSGGMIGNAKLVAYGTAKGGVMGLMNNLSEEGRPHGILCNAIMPNAASRLALSVGASALGENPWAREVYKTMDPAFSAGLVSYLASEQCTSTHAVYSAVGGRIAKVFVGVTKGWQGSRAVPPSAEEVAAQFELICDTQRGVSIPTHVADEFRVVVEGV